MNCLYETKGKKNMPGKSEREEGWNIRKNIINCLKIYSKSVRETLATIIVPTF